MKTTNPLLSHASRFEYLLMILFVLASGAKVWLGSLSSAGAFILFFFFSFYYHLKKNHTLKINKSFGFVIFVWGWSILSYICNGSPLQDNSMLGYMVCLFSTYLFIASFSFDKFRYILTNVVYYICLIGVPVFFLNELGVLPTVIRTLGDADYKLFGPFTLGWPWDFHRFSGIWHEPGACQIVLNSVLWLNYDKLCKWEWERQELRKIIVIIIGSLVTLSTGSYMCLMLLAASVVLNLNIRSSHRFLLYLSIFIVAIGAILIMFNSSVVQSKLFSDEENISKVQRTADILAFWEMSIEHPVLGYGVGTESFWKVSTSLGNTHNSSGVMTYLASLGYPWLLMFCIYIWRGIGHIVDSKSKILLLVAIILMQFNEKFIEYPITNMFIFYFLDYKKNMRYGKS